MMTFCPCSGPTNLSYVSWLTLTRKLPWVKEGESSSAFLFRLEKRRGADRWISALRLDDGTIASSPEDLCQSFHFFYLLLFSAESTDASVLATFLGNLLSSLSSSQSTVCGLLSVSKCLSALSGMARRKAPGSSCSKAG